MERTQIKNISIKKIDSSFLISGWVEKVRDHGGVIFLDVRDASGLMQVVVEPDDKELFKKSESIRMSYVLEVTGILRKRPEGTINESLSSGELELVSKEIDILSKSKPLPFQLDEHAKVGEEVRLKYRYLDLRRPEMQSNLKIRSQVNHIIRSHLIEDQFIADRYGKIAKDEGFHATIGEMELAKLCDDQAAQDEINELNKITGGGVVFILGSIPEGTIVNVRRSRYIVRSNMVNKAFSFSENGIQTSSCNEILKDYQRFFFEIMV